MQEEEVMGDQFICLRIPILKKGTGSDYHEAKEACLLGYSMKEVPEDYAGLGLPKE